MCAMSSESVCYCHKQRRAQFAYEIRVYKAKCEIRRAPNTDCRSSGRESARLTANRDPLGSGHVRAKLHLVISMCISSANLYADGYVEAAGHCLFT